MVDKVKPFKNENSVSGTENDTEAVETDPAEDYIATAGIAFANLDAATIDLRNGGVTQISSSLQFSYPSVMNRGITAGLVAYTGTSGLMSGSSNLTFNATLLVSYNTTISGSMIIAGLTTGRIPYTGTSGLIQNNLNLTYGGTLLTAYNSTVSGSMVVSALTSGRVPYATTSGLLTDNSNLTFGGTLLTSYNHTNSGSMVISPLTAARVPFASTAGLIVDAAGFVYTTGSNRLDLAGSSANSGVQITNSANSNYSYLTFLRQTSLTTDKLGAMIRSQSDTASLDGNIELLCTASASLTSVTDEPSTSSLKMYGASTHTWQKIAATTELYRNVSVNLSANNLDFGQKNASLIKTTFAQIAATSVSLVGASELGTLEIKTKNAGTLTSAALFTQSQQLLIGHAAAGVSTSQNGYNLEISGILGIAQKFCGGVYPPVHLFQRANGTYTSPTTIIAGDSLGSILYQYHVNGAYSNAGVFAHGIQSVSTGATCANTTWSFTNTRITGQVNNTAILGVQKDLTDATNVNIVSAECPSNTGNAFTVQYAVECWDGTDVQVETGIITYAIVNKAGTVTVKKTISGTINNATVGTLTVTAGGSAADPSVAWINADTTLVPGRLRVTYNVLSMGTKGVSIP